MPRRLIIGILILLILGILGGTAVLLVQRLRGDQPEVTTSPSISPGSLDVSGRGNQQVVNPTGDDDSDGLSNADEAVWGTDPTNPDADGDGFRDGDEVLANHNPTIAGPADTLPPGFRPGQNLNPLAEAPLQVDQLFEDNLDLRGPQINVTEEYNKQFKPEERTPENLTQFVRTQPIITKLPTVKTESLLVASQSNPQTETSYLAVAGNLDAVVNQDKLRIAFQDLFERKDGETLAGVIVALRLHQDNLRQLVVPPEYVNTQRLLLGYTELQAATLEQMLSYPTDPVKGLLAMHQLETIDKTYFPILNEQINQVAPTDETHEH